MKYFTLLVGFIICLLPLSYSQVSDFNMELLANVELGIKSNDVWGYVDENNTEYAIIGSIINSRIYSLADPSNPVLIETIPGGSSSWRDFKTFGTYLYIVADGSNDGLIIANLSQVSSGIVTFETMRDFSLGVDTIEITACHNLNIDEANGMLVLSGCRENGGGNLVFDLNTDPTNPELIAFGPPIYSHDNLVRDGIIYSSDLRSGLNIINAMTSEIMGSVSTGANFTHNAWINDDATSIFTTDERSNAFVESYDISDLDNIDFLDRYRPADVPGTPPSPHNVHFLNDYLITSYYSDGIKIIDAASPDNLIEVASYDTYAPISFSGFDGLWGAYPYLPSGLVLGSDQNSGLYVWRPTYERAFPVTGLVTNANTNELIFNATVEIENGVFEDFALTDNTDELGIFKTGFTKSQSGFNVIPVYRITVTKEGFEPFTMTFDITGLENMDFPNIELAPIVTGVDDLLEDQAVRILENPASDYFTIQFDQAKKDGKLIVYSANGQLMESIDKTGSEAIFGSHYNSGVYLLEFLSVDGYSIKKLVKR